MRARRSIPSRLLAVLAWAAASVAVAAPTSRSPSPRMPQLTLVVPAAVGGGWDSTAKAMKRALEADHLVGQVRIVRYPGAGGLVGLSQMIARYRGDGRVLMVGGLVMLGASLRDDSAVSLHDVTPIARLTGEWEMLAVPTSSPLRSLADLRRVLHNDPAKVRFVGGALGGPDQGLAFALAGNLGVPYDDIEYYGRAGGRRVTQALAEKRGDIALGGYAEFASAFASGTVRPFAVASPERIEGIAAPTLRELGVDATMMNWRGVFAPPGVSAADQDALTATMAAMADSPIWRGELARARWTSTFLDGPAFSQFIDREQGRWLDVINPPRRSIDLAVAPAPPAAGILLAAATGLALLIACVSLLLARLRQRRRATDSLEARCAELSQRLDARVVASNSLIKNAIDQDFGDWKLSGAEADVAWFMLRGLPLKEIADLRGTSERTVRQQAQAIYRKADLDGRSDLAGRVLERFI